MSINIRTPRKNEGSHKIVYPIKEGKTNEVLGYSAKELKESIEKKFTNGMTWENWGKWHIDHIKPVSSFDKSEKMSIINSLDNLQPLWAQDNLKKSNKLI